MRRIVIVGSVAKSSGEFLLQDIPSTSGRLDVLLRGMRAALLVSHGVRPDVVVYLVLAGEAGRAVSVRVDGAAAKYLRPDERSLATLIKKVLALHWARSERAAGFVACKPGVAAADGGLEVVLRELAGAPLCVLDERGADVHAFAELPDDAVFVLGDHLGLPEPARRLLADARARELSVGPVSLHCEDAIAVLHALLDRRAAAAKS